MRHLVGRGSRRVAAASSARAQLVPRALYGCEGVSFNQDMMARCRAATMLAVAGPLVAGRSQVATADSDVAEREIARAVQMGREVLSEQAA